MNTLSNSVYSSVFTYNPNVLTRPYQHLTTKVSIEQHHITCVSLDISILIVRFGDWAHVCGVDNPMSHQKQICCPSTKVSWLFDKLSDKNVSDDGLSLSVSVAVNKQISKWFLCQVTIPYSQHTKLTPVIITLCKSTPINESL